MASSNIVNLSLLVFAVLLFGIGCAHGRRGPQQLRPTRGFKEMELAAARNFGKRAVNMHVVNSILMEWIALESKIKGLKFPRSLQSIPVDALAENENDNDNSVLVKK